MERMVIKSALTVVVAKGTAEKEKREREMIEKKIRGGWLVFCRL